MAIAAPAPAQSGVASPSNPSGAIAPIKADTKGAPLTGATANTNPTAQAGYNPDVVNNTGQTNALVYATYGANPTIAQLYGMPTDADSLAASANAAKVAALSPAQQAANAENARQQTLRQYQSQIDGIMAAEAAARARITNAFAPVAAQDIGATTAEQARGGNLGSNVGSGAISATATADQGKLSEQIQQSDASYEQALSGVFKDLISATNDKAKALNDASSQGADALIAQVQSNRANAQSQAVSQAKAAIAAGLDPTNPNMKDYYQKWVDLVSRLTGLPSSTVQSTFTDTKTQQDQAAAATAKAQADATAAGRTTLSPGQQLVDANGKVIGSVPVTNKYQSVTTTDANGNQHVLVYDTTTGKFVGYAGGGAADVNAGGGTPSAATGAGSALGGASTAKTTGATGAQDTSSLLFGTNNDSKYASGTVGDAIKSLGVVGGANILSDAGIDPNAKLSDLPQAQRDALTKAIDEAGGFVNKNHNAPFAEYGLLSKTDFNPDNTTDQLAAMYIDKYIKTGSVPTASTLGRNIKPGLMAALGARAADLYYKATGNPLPNPSIIKAQQDIIAENYKLGNNLAIQEGTVKANVDLSLQNMNQNGLNSSGFKPLDDLIDRVKDALQDPNVGQYLAQNSTIQNELGSLLAVKNAGGTTVYDKLTSAGIIQTGDSPAQIKQKVTALIQEAGNFAKNLTNANATAYGFTDPLLQDSNNPARNEILNPTATTKSTNTPTATGGSPQSFKAPDGTEVIITD